MSDMTVVQAYIKFSKQMIILISGLPGSNKNKLGKELARIFKIEHINLRAFLKKDYNNEVELPNGSKVIDWDNKDAYDWGKFNSTVDEKKSEGVIITGFAFPVDDLKFTPDAHINLKISKRKYIMHRHEHLTKHKEDNEELFKLIDSPTESLSINKLIYPHYIEYTQASKINKFMNINEMTYDQVLDEVFDYLIDMVQKYLEKNHRHTRSRLNVSEDNDDSSSVSVSDSEGEVEDEEEPYIIAHVDPNDPTLRYIQ